ncbi:hypothetical protein FACS1894110_09760 [Spirochaetia bacterium]|nr:hypothetical protein FACS1894110_09760 [Spirochaetia bacterium]
MAIHVDQHSYNISVSKGNTFEYEVKLTDNNDPPIVLTPADYVLIKIRERNGKELYSASSPIVDNKFPFTLTNDQSELLPVGRQEWDFTIYINAVLDPDGQPIDGDHVFTPFFHPAEFNVLQVVSREGKLC